MYVDDFFRYIEPNQYNYTHNNHDPGRPVVDHEYEGYTKRADFNRSILGNPEKENGLIWYAERNKINHLVLFNTSWIFSQGRDNQLYETYRCLLEDFACRASSRGISIGLALNEHFHKYRTDVTKSSVTTTNEERVTRQMLYERLGNDTLWAGWDALVPIIEKFPNAELTINPVLNVMIGIRNFNKLVAEQRRIGQKSAPCTGKLGIASICTEYEWWLPNSDDLTDYAKPSFSANDLLNRMKDRFDNEFQVYLDALQTFKGDGGIERIESYLSPWWYPGLEKKPITPYTNQYTNTSNPDFNPGTTYYHFASKASAKIDRWMIAAWSTTPWDLNTQPAYLKMLQMMKGEVEDASYKGGPIEIMPIFYAESENFIKEEDAYPTEDAPTRNGGQGQYSNYVGDVLNKGASTGGKSIQQIQKAFKESWETDLKDGVKWKLNGFSWFMWSIMPHMIYSTDNALIDKVRPNALDPTSKELTDQYYHYFPDPADGQHTLQIYNAPSFENNDPSNYNGHSYTWWNIKSYFSTDPQDPTRLIWNPDDQHQDYSYTRRIHTYNPGGNEGRTIPEDMTYYVQTTDPNTCITTSIPVLVKFQNKDLYIKDHDLDDGSEQKNAPYPQNMVNAWSNVWVNQVEDGSSAQGLIHQPPRAEEDHWVHVRVTNKSNKATSGGEKLSVYYSMQKTSQPWPNNWIWHPVDGKFHGDRINHSPVYLPSISANKDTIINIFWKGGPDPEAIGPESEIYEFEFPDRLSILGRPYVNRYTFTYYPSFDFLARLERSENPPYGMVALEESNVVRNVMDNNAISMRKRVNIKITSTFSRFLAHRDPSETTQIVYQPKNGLKSNETPRFPKSIHGLLGWHTTDLIVTNHQGVAKVRLNLNTKDVGEYKLLQDGACIINLGDSLFTKWKASGSQGYGIEIFPVAGQVFIQNDSLDEPQLVLADSIFTTIKITEPNAWIGGIKMALNENYPVELGFRLDSLKAKETTGTDKYLFQLNQEVTGSGVIDEMTGFQDYYINYSTCRKPDIAKVQIGDAVNLTAHTVGANMAIGFQWLRNGEDVLGAVLPSLRPDLSDQARYSVRVHYDNGCIATSDEMELSMDSNPSPVLINHGGGQDGAITGIGKNVMSGFEVYPNPVDEVLTIKYLEGITNSVSVLLLTVDGKEMYSLNPEMEELNAGLQINLVDLVPGHYVLKILAENAVYQKVIIKK